MPFVAASTLDRLLMAAEADENFTKCERCGAWMFLDEECAATVSIDYGQIEGCWWSVTMREIDKPTCFGRRRGGDRKLIAEQ